MIIAVSGMVGSGKTTVAHRTAEILRTRGLDASVLRFQSLPCFTWLRSSLAPGARRETSAGAAGNGDPAVSWKGYRSKRLGLGTAALYLARILAFRVYRLTLRRDQAHIMNRYFYDLFPHYRIGSAAERAYLSILRATMPVPDLAILVVATPDTIAARRPDYSGDYLSAVGRGYSRMRQRFPELVEIRTDPTDNNVADLDSLLPKARGLG